MANLSSLANIPFYGAYVAKKQMNEDKAFSDIKEASALLGLKNAIQQQKDEQQLKATLSQGGDIESALQAAIRSGNVAVASKLAPLVEARRKANEGRVMGPGSQLLGPNNEVLHTVPFRQEQPQEPPDVRMVNFYQQLPDNDPRKALLKQIIDAKTRPPQSPADPLVPTRGPDGRAVYTPRSQAAGQEVPPSSSNRPPPAEIMRMNVALVAMDKALDSYEELLKKFNPRSWAMMSPTERANAKSLISGLQLEWKEAAALGALTGPDLAMMEKAVVDPASTMGAYYGTEGLSKQAKQAREYIKRRRDSILKFYPDVEKGADSAPPAQDDPLGIRKPK